MYRLGICFFLPVINALVTVQIHRKSYYDPLSSCAFIQNVSLSNDASIQSCSWECDYEHDCQTAVFFYDTKICLTFAELCTTGSIQPSVNTRASVICYRKNHETVITCPSTSTSILDVTASPMKITPVGIYALNISTCATWDQNGTTVAGNFNGTVGSDLASLSGPVSIFIDNSDVLYVCDRDNNRILKFYPNSTTGVIAAGNGTAGNDSNLLNGPKGVAIDQYGAIIVADSNNYRIISFVPNSTIGITLVSNSSVNPLGEMRDLHIDVNDNIYVTDSDNNQVVKYNRSSLARTVLAGGGPPGSGVNQLNDPYGSFLDANGTLYVADTGNHRVLKYLPGLLNGTLAAGNSTLDSNSNQFINPISIIVDNNGYIYVADSSNNRIVKWTTDYAAGGVCIIGCSGTAGNAANELKGPRDLKFDQHGNFYVTDQGNNRIQKFMIQLPTSTCSTSG